MPEKKLTDFQMDALQEVGNIGAGSSAVALTQFLNRATYMSIPKVSLDPLNTLTKHIKMPENKDIAIVSLTTISDLMYTLLVFFDEESVTKIVDLMTHGQTETTLENLSPLYKSLIKEIGSILALKYVEALNFFLKANSFPSPPSFRKGSVLLLKENELKELKEASTVLFIECDIFTSEKSITVDLAIVPHEKTLDRFIGALFSGDHS